VDPRGHSAAGRIMSMKKFNDTVGNPTRDHPALSSVLPAGFKPAIPASKRPQTHALDYAATGIRLFCVDIR